MLISYQPRNWREKFKLCWPLNDPTSCHTFSLVIYIRRYYISDDNLNQSTEFFLRVQLKNNVLRHIQLFNKQIDCRDLGHAGADRNGKHKSRPTLRWAEEAALHSPGTHQQPLGHVSGRTHNVSILTHTCNLNPLALNTS